MPYSDYNKRKEKSKEYYYKNREKVLEYQKKRIDKKYKEDPEFHAKKNFHRATIRLTGPLKGKVCTRCCANNDLHRHHLDEVNPKNFIIVCRKCHNDIHQALKQGKIAINE